MNTETIIKLVKASGVTAGEMILIISGEMTKTKRLPINLWLQLYLSVLLRSFCSSHVL